VTHAHAHAHAHGVRADADRRALVVALALILGLMAVEVVVGVLVSSLALLSDAAHMLTDAAALVLALVANKLARRPAGGAMTFGLGRAEILSAQANGATLLVLALLIIYEGVRRLMDPPDVPGAAVLVVALLGIAVNLAAAQALARAVILLTGFTRADGIAALVVAAIMLHAAYGLLKASGRVFLEAAPAGVDPDAIGRAMAGAEGVVEVHDLHVWEVTSGFPALSAHVLVGADTNCHAARRRLEALLAERFTIEHTTLQVEHEGGELLEIDPSPR
jgi:cobalt-zinc-cadmium efflux system protein